VEEWKTLKRFYLRLVMTMSHLHYTMLL
jgi:hypothetical protein